MTDEEVDKARRFRTDAEIVFMQLANQEGYDDHNIETIETALRLTSEQARAEGYLEGQTYKNTIAEEVRLARAEALEEAEGHLTKTADNIRGDCNGPDLLRRMAMEIRALIKP